MALRDVRIPVRLVGSVPRAASLVGQRFGQLVVLSRAANSANGRTRWRCVCDCGAEREVQGGNLQSGNTKSCGHVPDVHANSKDLTGQRFGKLVVVHRALGHPVRWVCRCDCGNEVSVRASNLPSGNSAACGCQRWVHGHAEAQDDGRRTTSEYRSWLSMRRRCDYPKHDSYPDYGGRGITVCDRWRDSFVNFLADMGPKPTPSHTIDRRDANGNYEPGNCRWATKSEQRRNTRFTKFGHTGLGRKLIRALHARGAQGKVLAAAFGVSQAFVSREVRRGAA